VASCVGAWCSFVACYGMEALAGTALFMLFPGSTLLLLLGIKRGIL